MTWHDDELGDLVRRLDPLAEAPDESRDTAQFVAAVEQRAAILARRRSRRRRWLAGGAAVVVLAAGGTAAALLLGEQPTSNPGSVGCRSVARLSASHTIVIEAAGNPAEACAALWRSGRLPDPKHPLPPDQPVPPLAACLVEGAVNVFPGDPSTLCTELGLEAAAGQLSAENRSQTEMTDYLATHADERGCMTVEEAAALAHEALERFGMEDWSVREPEAAQPGMECAVPFTISDQHQIGLGWRPGD